MPKIIYLASEDWYFVFHRLPLAVAALTAGYEVTVATRVHQHANIILQAGIKLIPLHCLRRSGLYPIQDLTFLQELLRIYFREKPDLVHHVNLKPVLYGTMIARFLGVR